MKNYLTSLAITVVIIIVFALQISAPGITENFALVSSETAKRPWILATSIFLHGSLNHLLGNVFALAVFGLILEGILGSRKFLAVYFSGGLIAGIISLPFYESALGASGAIFTVLGTLTILRPRMVVWAYGVPMPMAIAAIFWLLLDIGGVFYPTNIANIAHIAGLIFGIGAGYLVRQNAKKEPTKPKRENRITEEEFKQWEDEWM